MKVLLKHAVQYVGKNVSWFAKILLQFASPFPHLFFAFARLSGHPEAIMQKVWNINTGPLKGYRLANLLPLEIEPVLANSMEIRCSNLLLLLDIDASITLDVGASYGYYSLLLAQLVGKGRVYSFEPDWRSYARLTQNLALNRIENVLPVPVCISNSGATGFDKWNSRPDEPWLSGFVGDPSPNDQDATVVPLMSLDVFSQILNIQNCVRLIKIDVEGAELEVLKGTTCLLAIAQPLILCELHSSRVAQQVFDFFLMHQYEWEVVEYMNETRQHVLAFPASQAEHYRRIVTANLCDSIHSDSKTKHS